MLRSLAALSLLAVVAPAGAGAATPAAPATADAGSESVLKKVTCVSRTATGSRLAKTRECHTRSEWDRIADEERRSTLGRLREQAGRRE